MAETPDDALVLVTAGAAHRVDALDAKTLALRWSKPVAREPRAVLVAADGARAFVTHAGDGVVSVLDTTGAGDVARVSLALPVETLTLADHAIADDPARFARHANAIVRATSRDGREVLRVPVVDEAPVDPAAMGGYGGAGFAELMEPPPRPQLPGAPMRVRRVDTPFGRSALDVQEIDAERGTRARRTGSRALLDDCLLPRAAIANGDRTLVACFGGSSLVEIDSARGWPAIAGTFEVPRGPSALARVPGEDRAIVWSPLARALASVSLADGRRAVREVARARPVDALVLRGRELFHRTGDRAISRDGIACATCHPDGRDDGLVWGSPKGRRRPITLAGNESRATPFGWGAEHATMDGHVTETIRRLGGRGLSSDDREALFAYIRSMKPVPRAATEESSGARRGERAFRDRGCTGCHDEAAGYSDHLAHDVGAGGPTVTPSLVGVGARTTLFHDGRFRGVDDLLARAKDMGNVGALSATERADIAAFLREL
jgi:mono/diheme cytochrome c family protein